jgi:ribosome-binding protein aMBF1 (putative translation factor)
VSAEMAKCKSATANVEKHQRNHKQRNSQTNTKQKQTENKTNTNEEKSITWRGLTQ